MKKINKSRYAILGMLFDKPRSGYEIKKFMGNSTAHFWQESDASIYPMLKKLEAEGCVTSRSEFVGKRERKIFEITSKGKDDFSTWLELPVESTTYRNELLLKLFFGGTTSPQAMLKHLYRQLQYIKDRENHFRKIEVDTLSRVPDDHMHKIFWMMALRFGVLQCEAFSQWLIESIGILEKKF